MVVKRIAAAPIDDSRIGEGEPLAVVVDGAAGLAQHLGDARDGDVTRDRVLALWQRGHRHGRRGASDRSHGAIAEAEATARKADLTQHRGQGHRHPIGLLAVVGALQRPGHGDHGAAGGHAARQLARAGRGNAGNTSRPVGVLGLSVGLAHEVGAELIEADGVAGEKGFVVQALGHQCMGQPQQQRGVGVGVWRDPLGFQEGLGVPPVGTDVDEINAVLAAAFEPVAHGVAADAAIVDLGILERNAAEHDHKLAVPGDHGPRGVAAAHAVHRTDDVRQNDFGRRYRIGIDREGVATDGVHETVNLALRVVEAPGATPAVGPGVDRLVAVVPAHAIELRRRQVERAVPRHGHEGLAATATLRAFGTVIEPTLADHRLRDARRMIDRVNQRIPDRRGIRIVGDRMQRDQTAILNLGVVGAPMGIGSMERARGGCHPGPLLSVRELVMHDNRHWAASLVPGIRRTVLADRCGGEALRSSRRESGRVGRARGR